MLLILQLILKLVLETHRYFRNYFIINLKNNFNKINIKKSSRMISTDFKH